VRIRGGEKVLEALAELLPDAPVYTLVCDRAGLGGSPLASRAIHPSWLQAFPFAARHYPRLVALMPAAARAVKLPPADLVLCSDAALAKAMTPDPRSKVVCYCHSPMRYVYEPTVAEEYRRALPLALRPFWGRLVRHLRNVDLAAAQRVNAFVANSRTVAQRIRRDYGREATVVYPPVDLPREPTCAPREPFYLCVGYHTAYKRLDLAVEACRRLGRRLVVIGEGPEVKRLRANAGPCVTWLGRQPDDVVADHYRRAAALLFPGEEDFGIVPVEAMAHGCPVVVYGRGGATETVLPKVTGVWFDEPTAASLAQAMEASEKHRFDPTQLHTHARQFSRERFLGEMRAVLSEALAP
jgi:glycosyltransferase involved in cell wall biosynthesis